ncbi:unnamed protein product (macronuclear) [Paramecium tetraurelia]|uniref:Uncharacterized protein n=1 Tax=Paramecium tetraurelia TaxID=5888 RepID=A0D0M8_PARTE|nr:uncharacterized protein GSPATT00012147001 [Paramecium tetraurelia]CAK76595.1 unnamed protein product [Paramecium tetraurelia]|eukprot:XP_001443992.1 hypothetical protein (macronuclear) [Paramecium tetraurelia strain d4-2]
MQKTQIEQETGINYTWNNEEDQKLKDSINIYGIQWNKVAETIPGKTESQCIQRWHMLQNEQQAAWSKGDDEQLMDLVLKYGENWSDVAQIMKNKTQSQIKSRFNQLNFQLSNRPWNQEEDNQLLLLFEQYGTKWNQIAQTMKYRTEIEVKNRYYSKHKLSEHQMTLNLKISDSEIEKQEEMESKTFKTEFKCKQELQTIEPQPIKKVDLKQSDQQQKDSNISYLCPRNFIFKFEQLFDSSQNEPKKIVWIPVPIIRITKRNPTTNDNLLEQSVDDLKQEEELQTRKN